MLRQCRFQAFFMQSAILIVIVIIRIAWYRNVRCCIPYKYQTERSNQGMNCNNNSGCQPRRPVPGPDPCQTCQGQRLIPNQPCQNPGVILSPPCQNQRPDFLPQGPGPVVIGPNMAAGFDRYPIGMGYVPMQNWETPFPMDRGFQRGTIFPSLDYPFVMGRCRR